MDAKSWLVLLVVIFLPWMEAQTPNKHGGQGPRGSRYIIVDKNGGGNFATVQAAVDSVRERNRDLVTIEIRPGIYEEKVLVPMNKPFITFQGWGMDRTIIQWHNKASDIGPDGQEIHTYNTASVTVLANRFTAKNISFKNTAPAPPPGVEGWQALAFRIAGDKAYFLGCGFYGAQDTLCDDMGRHFFRECFIQGSIDFIFGDGQSLYYKSELHSIAQVFGSLAAHGRQLPYERTGFSFVQCRVTGTGPLYLGRAMGDYSRIVYAYTYFDDIIAGWDDWGNEKFKQRTAFFGLYRCFGPGAVAAGRTSWAHELTPSEATPFLRKSFVNGADWLPEFEF